MTIVLVVFYVRICASKNATIGNDDFFKVGTGFIYELGKDDIFALSANRFRSAILNSPRFDIFRGTDGEFDVIPLDYLNYGIESDLGKDGIYWGLERVFDR
jgi:hypothetical protein